jgi:hypothetical protein
MNAHRLWQSSWPPLPDAIRTIGNLAIPLHQILTMPFIFSLVLRDDPPVKSLYFRFLTPVSRPA